MKIKKWLSVAAIATVAGLTLAACASSAEKATEKATKETTVKIATVNRSGSEEARWDKIQELVEKDGIKLEFTEFTDYSQPNKAVANVNEDRNFLYFMTISFKGIIYYYNLCKRLLSKNMR